MELNILKDILVDLPVVFRKVATILNENIVGFEVVKDEAAIMNELEDIENC